MPDDRSRKPKAPLQELLRGAWAAAHGLASDAEQEAKRLTERRLEEEVRAYLSRLRFPSRQDLAAMSAHVEGLEARLSALERRHKAER